jgi:hypothetical protein
MSRIPNLSFTALVLAASVSILSAQTLLWSDTSFVIGPDPAGWNTGGFPGSLATNDGQLIVTENFFGRLDINNPLATHVPAAHIVPSSGPLPDGQKLELRADLISASPGDAVASVVIDYVISGVDGYGYTFNKAVDGLWLTKFYYGNGVMNFACFLYVNQPLKNENVTLVLALTRAGPNLNITTRVLDKDNGNAVLFDRTVTDTPKADPVLPSRTVKGMIGMADPVGTPWPLLKAPTWIELTLTWCNPLLAPNPPAQVIFENVELWQYDSPQLTIQDAVVISWPVPQGQFALESAPSLAGPWAPVANPWTRTNNGVCEVSVPRTDSVRFFRLRFAP